MLTDAACRAAKPRAADYRIADGGSLYLVVRPSGGKAWEYRWKRDSTIRKIGLGSYPEMGVARARLARDEHRTLIAKGLDPLAQRRINSSDQRARLAKIKAEREVEREVRRRERATFERVAGEWMNTHREAWTPKHAAQVEQSLADYVFPIIGGKTVDAIDTTKVLAVLDPLLAARKLETASRVKQRMSAVFEFAALRYKVPNDPTSLVKREFTARVKQARKTSPVANFPCIDLDEVPRLLRAMREYTGPSVRLARLIALTGCRTGEARAATWSEFDLRRAIWTIPADRMKARRPHRIPLSRQALLLLKQVKVDSGDRELLFPHPTKSDQPASENAVLFMLASIGYKGRMTGHGFRSLFSTAANRSKKWDRDLIESALAHAEENDVRAAYLRTDFHEERAPMMQWWADELDRLETFEPT